MQNLISSKKFNLQNIIVQLDLYIFKKVPKLSFSKLLIIQPLKLLIYSVISILKYPSLHIS